LPASQASTNGLLFLGASSKIQTGESASAGESEGQFQPGALWADEAAKSSGAFVLTVRPPGDRLIQATHEPTDVSQTLAANLNPSGIGDERLDGFVPRSLGYSLGVAFWKQAAPSERDLFGRPGLCQIRAIADD
jgi:hypothetical protein